MAWSDHRVPTPPLSQLTALEVLCEPCGRTRRMEGDKVGQLVERGYRSIDDLEGRLVCSACAERRRLTIIPYFRRAGQAMDASRVYSIACV